jgi:hypothetical protein
VSAEEEKLEEGPVDEKEYVKAMLKERKWYMEDWKSWQGDGKAKMVGRALVVVRRLGCRGEEALGRLRWVALG